jgi:hypothetical protein
VIDPNLLRKQTDIQQRKLLHELNRIANALERLADQWEENEKEVYLVI